MTSRLLTKNWTRTLNSVSATADYYLGDEKKTPDYKMIAHIDDLVSMIKKNLKEVEEKKEKVVLNLIYLGDRLT